MSWSTFFGPDGFTGTQYTSLPTYDSSYTQDVLNGTWRISTNGTSAGCTVISTARCALVSAPADDQAAEFTVNGSNLDLTWGIAFRFTDGDSGNFWGGTGYVAFNDQGNSRLRLERLDGGGSHTQLAVSSSYTPSSGDVFRFEIVGDQIDVLINGSGKISTTDSTYTSGTVALWAGTSLDDFVSMSVDDFTVYEAAAGGKPWYYYAQQWCRPRLPRWMRSPGGILIPTPAFRKVA